MRELNGETSDPLQPIVGKLMALRDEFRRHGATSELVMQALSLMKESQPADDSPHAWELRDSCKQLYKEMNAEHNGYRVETIPLTPDHPKVGTRQGEWCCVSVAVSEELSICEVTWKRIPH